MYLKEKESPARFYVIKNDPAKSGNDHPRGYLEFTSNKFILTNLQEARAEKVQILETFGEPVLYFYDERTRVYSLAGYFLNSDKFMDGIVDHVTHNWSLAFKRFYEQQLRGTKLSAQGNIAILSVDGMLIYGYPISFSIATTSINPNTTAFSMSYLVTKQVVTPSITNASLTNIQSWQRNLDGLWQIDKTNLNEAQSETVDQYISKLNELQTDIDTLKDSLFVKQIYTTEEDRQLAEKELKGKELLYDWYQNELNELRTNWLMNRDPN